MTKQEQFDIAEQLRELMDIKPVSVKFMGKPREVYFFHRGTAELFSYTIKGVLENESMKRRKQREIKLLAIVLANLYGSSRYFKRLKRWLWRKRLAHSKYNELEAMALLATAKNFIQYSKQMEAMSTILLVEMIKDAVATGSVSREQLVKVFN